MGGRHKLVDDIPGERSCIKCGLTITTKEETGYTDPGTKSQKTSYEGPVVDEGGVGSDVGYKDEGYSKTTRLPKWLGKNYSSFEREVNKAKDLIKKKCSDTVGGSTTQNRALALFKKARKGIKGKHFETFVEACIFIACREQGIALDAIAKVFARGAVTEKEETKKRSVTMDSFGNFIFRNVEARDFVISIANNTKLVKYYKEICIYCEINLPPSKAIDNVEWIGKRVKYDIDRIMVRSEYTTHVHDSLPSAPVGTKLPGVVIRKAIRLLDKIPDSETGSNPVGIAAAILWIVSVASELPFTQKQFAKAAGMNPQTISNSAKRLNKIIKKNKLGKYVDPNTKYYQKRRAGKYVKRKYVEKRKQKNSHSTKWLEARRRKLLDGTS